MINNFFKRIYNNLSILWYSMFFGMRGADTLLTTSQKTSDNYSMEVPGSDNGGVFKDILEQKITQEVEELRYTSYKIANESKKYRYIGNGKVLKKTESQLTEKHGIIEESDNLPIVLIQDNNIVCEDVLSVLNEVNEEKNKKNHQEYNIKIKRSLLPRFRIEDYIKKIVVKTAGSNHVIDLYCSKYPRQFSERKDRAFLSELKKIKNGLVKDSDILEFDEISFITTNAWGVDDWLKFSFIDFEYYDIIEFDGNFIIRLGCVSNAFYEDILSSIYSQSAEDKYSTKQAKANSVFIYNNIAKNNEYKVDDNIDLDKLENIKFKYQDETCN